MIGEDKRRIQKDRKIEIQKERGQFRLKKRQKQIGMDREGQIFPFYLNLDD